MTRRRVRFALLMAVVLSAFAGSILGARMMEGRSAARVARAGEAGFSTSVPAFVFFEDDPNRRTRIAATYLLGLAQLGLGEAEAAKSAFEAVLALDANHVDAGEQLRRLESA